MLLMQFTSAGRHLWTVCCCCCCRLDHQAAENNNDNSAKAKGYLKQVQQYQIVATTCIIKDVFPTLTKLLSVFFQKETVGLASVQPVIASTIHVLH